MAPLVGNVLRVVLAAISASSLSVGSVGRATDRPAVTAATAQTASGVRNRLVTQAGALRPPAQFEVELSKRVRTSIGSEIAREPRLLRVCPSGAWAPECEYKSLQDALGLARSGDSVVLASGLYEEGAVITTPNVVLRGEPGAHLRGHAVEGKAALVVKADNVVIEGIECSGIAVRDGNGACVRNEGRDLKILNVHFHDNEQGILGGSPSRGVLLVEDSLFERNGFGGQAHGVYVNREIETFIFRRNRVLATKGSGHGVKSRAQRTILEDSIIAGLDGEDSRAIDISNGGEVVIRGNVLEKGPNSENGQMIGLALEGSLHEVNNTLIEDNLIVFDTLPHGLIQDLARAVGLLPPRGILIVSGSPGSVLLRNNVIVGARKIGEEVIDRDNRFYSDRREADLPPYPALPRPDRNKRAGSS